MDTPKPRRRATVVCRRDDEVLLIELEDPTTTKRMWSLPGGMIEAGETPAEAAVRETLEETGYRVVPDEGSEQVTRYLFRWNAILFDCQTHWFLGTTGDRSPAPVDDAAYLLGHRWLPVTALAPLLSYHPHICQTTLAMLR